MKTKPFVIAGNLAIATGLVVISGWIFGIEIIKSGFPSSVTMKFGTAIAFLLTGLLFRELAHKKRRETRIIALSTTIISLMALFLIVEITGVAAPDWLTWATKDRAVQSVVLGIPSLGTQIAFIALAAAGIVSGHKHGEKYAEVLGLFVALLGLCAFAGHLLNQPTLYYAFPVSNTGMAIHTAILFTLLGFCLAKCKSKSI